MQSTFTSSLHAIPLSSVRCAICEEAYTTFIRQAADTQLELSALMTDLTACQKQSRSRPPPTSSSAPSAPSATTTATATTGLSGNEPEGDGLHPSEESSQYRVSTPFVNGLKLLVRGRKRLLSHPERCTCSQYRNQSVKLEPTANLLCVRMK